MKPHDSASMSPDIIALMEDSDEDFDMYFT